jgi:hypothetical protein
MTTPIQWIRETVGYTPARALGVGVVLLAVPTFFTVFPGFTDWLPLVRAVIVGVWIVTAVVTVTAATKRDEAIQQLSDDRKAQLRQLRLIATTELLAALLRPGTKNIPAHYEFTVYLFDEDQDLLRPICPTIDFRDAPDPRVFAPGNGATGSAWRDRQTVVVTGSEVANAKYGLTPEQQEYFAGYQTAVPTPIWEDATTPFGVLTALGTDDDGYFSDQGSGRDSLQVLSDTIGVLLRAVPEPEDLP